LINYATVRTGLTHATTLVAKNSRFASSASPSCSEKKMPLKKTLRNITLLCNAACALLAVSAHAEESSPWHTDLELGYVSTSGNTETTTVKTRADVTHTTGVWKNTTHFDSLNTSEEEGRSAEKYFVSNKLDYKWSDSSYWFAYGSFDDDRFSGFEWQATAAAGYGRTFLLDRENMNLDIEAGPGYRSSKLDEALNGDDENEVILRGYGKYQWNVSQNAVFEQELSMESGADNTISKSISSLKTTIVGALALKLAYTVKYTDEVPSGKKHADTETSVTVVYSF